MATATSGWRSAVEAQMEGMSPRDRTLLVGLLGFFALVLVGAFWWFLQSTLEDNASRVRAAGDEQEMLETLANDYKTASEKVAAAEQRLQASKDTPPSAYIDQVAARLGVQGQLSAVNEGESQKIGNLKQTSFRVELKAVSLQNAVDFIYSMETGEYPVVVELARLKSVNQSTGKVYDLSMELRAYRLEEG